MVTVLLDIIIDSQIIENERGGERRVESCNVTSGTTLMIGI